MHKIAIGERPDTTEEQRAALMERINALKQAENTMVVEVIDPSPESRRSRPFVDLS